MIDISELARRPHRERDLLSVATDGQTIEYFQRQMEVIRTEVMSPIRLPRGSRFEELFHMSGVEKYSLIAGDTDKRSGKSFPQLKIERERGQDLLFKTMKAYGFDETKTFGNADTSVRSDGTTREVIVFPSRNINGLSFKRVQDFVTETGKPVEVWWRVERQSGDFKVDIKAFRKHLKPQIRPD